MRFISFRATNSMSHSVLMRLELFLIPWSSVVLEEEAKVFRLIEWSHDSALGTTLPAEHPTTKAILSYN